MVKLVTPNLMETYASSSTSYLFEVYSFLGHFQFWVCLHFIGLHHFENIYIFEALFIAVIFFNFEFNFMTLFFRSASFSRSTSFLEHLHFSGCLNSSGCPHYSGCLYFWESQQYPGPTHICRMSSILGPFHFQQL